MTLLKNISGYAAALLIRQCRFENALFLIGHMRCGSTALASIICSRSDMNGYGEAHVRYASRSGLGVLALNQIRRSAWNGAADYVFDKILHSRYDSDVSDDFFNARAIFLAREPGAAIASIRRLFNELGSNEYTTDDEAAHYYIERMTAMIGLWSRFSEKNRVAVNYADLAAEPEAQLRRISHQLDMYPALENRYQMKSAARSRGAGDPLNAARFNRIVAPVRQAGDSRSLAVSPATLKKAEDCFLQFRRLAEQK